MALVPLHEAITKETLRGEGFSEDAAERAATANAAVDEKQGSDAAESNLHAMGGFVADSIFGFPRGHLQDRDETRKAVEKLLADARQSIVAKIRSRKFAEALQELGEALHTVQDRAFHNFEPWPYQGIGDAIREDPNYMFAHGVRDLGGISRLDVRTTDGAVRYAAEWTFQLGQNSYLSIQGFTEQGASSARGARVPGSSGMDTGFSGTGGLLTFTLGAAPGSVPAPRGGSVVRGTETSPVQSMMTQGPASRATARVASRAFLDQVKAQVVAEEAGERLWEQFRSSE
jgi:hypothetical protein